MTDNENTYTRESDTAAFTGRQAAYFIGCTAAVWLPAIVGQNLLLEAGRAQHSDENGMQEWKVRGAVSAGVMSVHFSSQSVDWATPKKVYEDLDVEFQFNYDPCPLGGGEVNGLAPLFSVWSGKRVYCNPPYGRGMAQWLERGLEAEIAVFLIPARTDTKWFHEIVLPFADEIRFIKGRLKFGDAIHNAPFPSMVVIFRSGKRKSPAE